ncbi:MAG: hypothetical protein M1823_002665 [Watsoniomyces obsoletus]|nr:MAG: hypothetical protein M1823_002665 [Watsoniomyces obsoletus]
MVHIPLLTLPEIFFKNPAVAILFPIAIGTGFGFYLNRSISASTQKVERDYATFKKPRLNPPAWVFGPVWTVLYGLMGYASYRAWNTGMASFSPSTIELAKQGATLYTVQLGINQMFMPLFFAQRRAIAGVVDIVALTAVNYYLTYIWNQVDPRAAYAMLPYLAWLTFATYLATSVGVLNDWDLRKTLDGDKGKGKQT